MSTRKTCEQSVLFWGDLPLLNFETFFWAFWRPPAHDGPRPTEREGDWRQNITSAAASAAATSNLKSTTRRQIAFGGRGNGGRQSQHVPFLTFEMATCQDDQRLGRRMTGCRFL